MRSIFKTIRSIHPQLRLTVELLVILLALLWLGSFQERQRNDFAESTLDAGLQQLVEEGVFEEYAE